MSKQYDKWLQWPMSGVLLQSARSSFGIVRARPKCKNRMELNLKELLELADELQVSGLCASANVLRAKVRSIRRIADSRALGSGSPAREGE